MKHGADVLIKNKKGNTPLHCILGAPRYDSSYDSPWRKDNSYNMGEKERRRAKILLFYTWQRNQLPELLQTRNINGETPIQVARTTGNKDFAKFLEYCGQQKEHAINELVEIGKEQEVLQKQLATL